MRRFTPLILLLAACGQKGPLYLPPEQPPTAPAQEQAPEPESQDHGEDPTPDPR